MLHYVSMHVANVVRYFVGLKSLKITLLGFEFIPYLVKTKE